MSIPVQGEDMGLLTHANNVARDGVTKGEVTRPGDEDVDETGGADARGNNGGCSEVTVVGDFIEN